MEEGNQHNFGVNSKGIITSGSIVTKKEIYNHLKEIASQLDIRISEQNLSATRVYAKSGLCRIKGEYVMIMEKRLSLSEKIAVLGDVLKSFPTDHIYIIPAVREFLNKI